MTRKNTDHPIWDEGKRELFGVILVGIALLLAFALFTFDKYDLPTVHSPPNHPLHNWVGPVGAWLAGGLFFCIGGAAYLLPFVFLGFGLAWLIPKWRPWARRWPAAVLFLIAVSAALDWGTNLQTVDQLAQGAPAPSAGWLEHLTLRINTESAGGMIGYLLDRFILKELGRAGSAICIGIVLLTSLYLLTAFQFGRWLLKALSLLLRKGWLLIQKIRDLLKIALQTLLHRVSPSKPSPEQLFASPSGRDTQKPKIYDFMASVETTETESPMRKKSHEPILKSSPKEAPPPPTQKQELRKPLNNRSARSKPNLPPAKPSPSSHPSRPQGPIIENYRPPPLSLLDRPRRHIIALEETHAKLVQKAKLIQQTLAEFGIQVSLGDITRGPTITRFELHPAPGVKLEKITALTNNLAAALKAERIHILAPIPGKGSVGVEVPNKAKSTVTLRELMESDAWRNTTARIPLALGKDVYGHPIIADLAEMPHLLIAGATGSGKSVCINSIVASLLYRFGPDQLRFVMIDPKVVELQHYNPLPHLVVPVVTDPKKVILALRWVLQEMEKRYKIFAKVGVRNIYSFNRLAQKRALEAQQPELPLSTSQEEGQKEGFAVELDEEMVDHSHEEELEIPDHLSYIVVIIDELADLMLVAPSEVEMAIARITQMARAAGIHCIIATQRPSVDVITGVIKANIPSRIAFQVASKVDSRTILDVMGAEKLLGKGDMLFLPPGSSQLIRAQGAYITDQEIERLVAFIAKQGSPRYEVEIHQALSRPVESIETDSKKEEDEALLEKCIEVIRSEQKASVSLLQRRLRLGYTRAARLMDELERRGIVGPSKGAEPRDILIDLDATDPLKQASSEGAQEEDD